MDGASRYVRMGIVTLAMVLAGVFMFVPQTSAAVNGSVVARAVDQDGLPVRGNCFRLQGTGYNQQLCDALDGTVDGVATFAGVPFGSYTLSQSYTPVGFAAPSPNGTTVDVVDATPVQGSLTSNRTDLRVTLQDSAGNPVAGACFNVASGNYSRTLCDASTNSGGSNGVTLIDYVPSGAVTLTETSGPSGFEIAGPRSVTVVAGQVNATTVTVARVATDVTVASVDQDGRPVRGACFFLQGKGNLCDALDGVVDGRATYTGASSGTTLTVKQIYTPIGFAAPSPSTSTITPTAAGPNVFTFTSLRTDLEVTLLDQIEQPVLGACFTVSSGNYTRGPLCDASSASGGTNGVTLIDYVPGGSITLTQNSGPEGATLLAPQSVSITPGARNSVTLHTTTFTKVTVTLASVDQDGGPVRGACFSLTRGSFASFRCDSQDGTVDGRYTFSDVPSLTGYSARQTYTPIGFGAPSANPIAVDVAASGGNTITFTSPRTDLQVTLVDGSNNPVAGACVNVTTGNYSRTLCDNAAASGGNNGVTLLTFSPAPSTTVTVSGVPADYQSPAPVAYTDLVPGTLNQRTITVQLKPATLALDLVVKDANNNPITAADQGDVVTYAAVVRNTSANRAFGVTYADSLGNACGPVTLQPDNGVAGGPDELTCNPTHTVDAAERQAGTLPYTGTAAATNAPSVRQEADLAIRQAAATLTLSVWFDPYRTQPVDRPLDVGDRIYVGYEAYNSGPSRLTNATIVHNDSVNGAAYVFGPVIGEMVAGGNLGAGFGPYIITAYDRDHAVNGEIDYWGTVLADQLDTGVDSNHVVLTVNPAPTVTVTKTAYRSYDSVTGTFSDPIGSGTVNQGDTIWFEIQITNGGPGKLTNVYAYDALPAHGIYDTDCNIALIAANETKTCSASWTVDGQDRLNGQVTDTVTVYSDQAAPASSNSVTVAVNESAVVVSVSAYSDAALQNEITGAVDEGDTIYIAVKVTNTGDSPLTNVDADFDFTRGGNPGWTNTSCDYYTGSTAPVGGSVDCTLTWYVSADDRHEGAIHGYGTATATELTAWVNSGEISIPVNETAATVALYAYADADRTTFITGAVDQGDTIHYRAIVTNTGDGRLDNVYASVNPSGYDYGAACANTSLLAGQATSCDFDYTVVAADRAAGKVTATSMASASQLDAPVDTGGGLDVPVNASEATVTLAAYSDVDRTVPITGAVDQGDTIFYRLTVENTGESRLDNTAAYFYANGSYWTSCSLATIDSGATNTCDFDWYVSSLDRANGQTTGRVDVYAFQIDGFLSTSTITTVVNGSNASVTLAAFSDEARTIPLAGPVDQGDTIYYLATLTNTGASRLVNYFIYLRVPTRNPYSAVDSCDRVDPIPAGETRTCAFMWSVDQTDRQLGHIDAYVLMGATPLDGVQTSDTVSVAVNATAATVTLAAFSDEAHTVPITGPVDQGDTIYYLATLTNTGASRLNSSFGYFRIPSRYPYYNLGFCSQGDPIPAGETATCAFAWTVDQTDRSAGHVDTYVVMGASQLDGAIASDTVAVPINATAATVTLAAFSDEAHTVPITGPVDQGDTIYYLATLTNTGAGKLGSFYATFYVPARMSMYGYHPTCYAPDPIPAGGTAACAFTWGVDYVDRGAGHVDAYVTASAGYLDGQLTSDTLSVYVNQPSVALTTTVYDDADNALTDGATVEEGQQLTIKYTLVNSGPGRVDGTGMSLYVGGIYVGYCSVETVAAGDTGTCPLLYTVPGETAGTDVSFSATAYASQVDGQLNSNVATVHVAENNPPTAVTNPITYAVDTTSGTLPDSVLDRAGVADPDGDEFYVSGGAFAGDGQPNNWLYLNGDGTGSFYLSDNVATTFHVLVTDARGGESTVDVVIDADTTAPDVSLSPDDTVIEATASYGAAVTFSVSASDDRTADPTWSCDLDGSYFSTGDYASLGVHTVTCTATDNAGNIGTASFDVTVEDTTAPTLSVSPDSSSYAAPAYVTFSVNAEDTVSAVTGVSCTIDQTGATFDPRDGVTIDEAGDYTFTCSAEDEHTNGTGPVSGGGVTVTAD